MQSQIKHSVAPVAKERHFSVKPKTVVIAVLLVLMGVTIWAIGGTALVIHSLQNRQLSRAANTAQLVSPVANAIAAATFHVSPEIELWKNSLQLIPLATSLQSSAHDYFKLALQNNEQAAQQSGLFLTNLRQFDAVFLKTIKVSQKSLLFQKLIQPKLPTTVQMQLEHTDILSKKIPIFENVLTEFLHGDHRIILVFQNSEELRATGGFIGSYAVVDISNGAVAPIQFYDIFDADGQITTEFEAPPGVKEYLSGGHGLRLPNANWNPDFPSSAQDLLQYFALAKVQNVDGLVAINLSVVEDLLKITGPINLPDYPQAVTAQNVSQMARADRAEYFPGSKQKKNFLRSLSTQLRLSLESISASQQLQLAQTVVKEVEEKSIQLFFHQHSLQQFTQSVDAAGQITQFPQTGTTVHQNPLASPMYLSLVESNVGINKANRLVQRQVNLNFIDKQLYLQIFFMNRNPNTRLSGVEATPSAGLLRENPHNDYINYQRLLIPSDTSVIQITQDGKNISSWDESTLTTAAGEKLKQVGFLVPVTEEKTSTLQIQLGLAHSFQLNPTLILQKQSGLPPTPFTIQYRNQVKNLVHEQDEVIQFTP